jgi:hypothetical protein
LSLSVGSQSCVQLSHNPTAARQIDTSRIGPMNGPFRVEYYADVEWTDNAPAMVQLLLIQSFQNTGRLPVVVPTRQILATDFLLLSKLRKIPGGKRCIGNSASNRHACSNGAADAAPHTSLDGAFRECDTGWFQIDRNRHCSLDQPRRSDATRPRLDPPTGKRGRAYGTTWGGRYPGRASPQRDSPHVAR